MTPDQDTILSVTQMLLASLIKSRKFEILTRDIIREQVVAAAGLVGSPDLDLEALTDELARRFDVFVQKAAILVEDDQHERWVADRDRSNWRFWARCETYLRTMLPEPVVARIDEDTDEILNLIGDPAVPELWDRRGLVVGDVQSGKTSNYAALACKAADAGYRIIIILAGVHESLRMQTQIRMDEAFLGYRTDATRALTGVGLLDPSVTALAATARSQKGDFNKIVAGQLVIPEDIGSPVMLVVKKNANMLRNLHAWLEKVAKNVDGSGRRVIRNAPALIIDDESDNASVDTGEQSFSGSDKPDLQHRPTAINELIRRILHVFEHKSYVGYTATPFANIFIHHEGQTETADKDLFPKNFIVNLHAPSNYFGPARAFGLEGEGAGDDVPQSLVRLIDGTDADTRALNAWVPARHKQLITPGPMPDSLARAILSFVLACAVRKLRGQVSEHNSMLVHVTRFTRVQGIIAEQIEEMLVRVRRRLRFGDEGVSQSVKAELRQLWESDFVPTTAAMRAENQPDVGELPSWSEIEKISTEVAANIRVKQINGLAQDVLDYDSYRESGIDVIAVGGDKLSRGLTLYGLTVSYFARQTDMYDTLLQMGRWFGYRSGYLDLCRLYTTRNLDRAFTHIAIASDELRRDFDYMAQIGARPIDYGLKVQSHPVLSPTSSNKRRHARDVVIYQSYAGGISEAKSFSLDPGVLARNKTAADRLMETLHRDHQQTGGLDPRRSYDASMLWRGISTSTIENFLAEYVPEKTSTRARSDLWLRYINKQNALTGELSTWNVAVIGGDVNPPVDLGGVQVKPRRRERDKSVDQGTGYRIKRLVTTRDAGIDLSAETWNLALELDPMNRLNGVPRSEPTAHALCLARQRHSLNPLLMIYLPQPADYISLSPVIGPAIAFPGSDHAVREEVVYAVNSVYQASLQSEEEED
jgi:hypothetical protein